MLKNLMVILSFMIAFSANAQKITLQSKNECYIAACYNPKNGFALKEKPVINKANNDRFVLNFNSGFFTWQDNKGSNSYKMYNVKISENKLIRIFNTENHVVRCKINNNGVSSIEIVCLLNGEWYNLLYPCNVK